jgi:hypothetical protein
MRLVVYFLKGWRVGLRLIHGIFSDLPTRKGTVPVIRQRCFSAFYDLSVLSFTEGDVEDSWMNLDEKKDLV